nr:MAG TPA: hypothetical protein [Caudoviricetes sp.]
MTIIAPLRRGLFISQQPVPLRQFPSLRSQLCAHFFHLRHSMPLLAFRPFNP